MSQPFKLYRIICTINGKALVSGSNLPHDHRCPAQFQTGTGQWYDRGDWSRLSGSFWKTRYTVEQHLLNLCHDWRGWKIRRSDKPDLSRLQYLRVETIRVTEHTTSEINAADFLGVTEQVI